MRSESFKNEYAQRAKQLENKIMNLGRVKRVMGDLHVKIEYFNIVSPNQVLLN